jgi:hypothetical protein
MSRPLPGNLNTLLLNRTVAIETSLVTVKQHQQEVCNHLPESAISRGEELMGRTVCIKAVQSSPMHLNSVLRCYARRYQYNASQLITSAYCQAELGQ